MIKFENTEVVGWEAAIRGMRNPLNSWNKADSIFMRADEEDEYYETNRYNLPSSELVSIGDNDHDLMMRLRNAGTDHRKFMRMITVYVDIIAPLYFYKELDTYRFGVEKNSCSTMHTIHKRDFVVEDFSYDHLSQLGLDTLKRNIEVLNAYRAQYINTKNKEDWYTLIQLLPSSYNQRRTYMFSYEAFANIYKSRQSHKLDEWRDLCNWIKTLPYSELVIGNE